MKTNHTVTDVDGVKTFIKYHVPDMYDRVFDYNQNEGYCSSIFMIDMVMYEIQFEGYSVSISDDDFITARYVVKDISGKDV